MMRINGSGEKTTYVLSVALFKGGTGKTMSAWMLGSVWLSQGKKVLYLDLDNQSNLAKSLQVAPSQAMFNLITDPKFTLDKAIVHTDCGDVVPNCQSFSDIQWYIDPKKAKSAYTVLRDKIRSSKAAKGYDYIIIDTPPSGNSLVTMLALTASDGLVVVGEDDDAASDALTNLISVIRTARQTNRSLSVLGVLLTRVNANTKLHRKLNKKYVAQADVLQTRVLSSWIRQCADMKNARHEVMVVDKSGQHLNALFNPAVRYAGATATQDYIDLAAELETIIKGDDDDTVSD